MRQWIDLFESYGLASVNNDDIIDYYQENHRDLETLLDNEWTLTTDYSEDITRLKREIATYINAPTITVYRAMNGNPDTTKLGIHWSVDPKTDFGKTVITVEAPLEAVDWVGTVARGVHWWDDEHEITLLQGSEVMIRSIVDVEGFDETIFNIVGKI